ncbi:hypothetical protein BGW36DRAFT_358426 [Talaromyces proteolyticus]|uniref:Pathway-specific nitrogen regulator n=1 Tax=Talaromyces proteolyticus TaxID=1131652 RepID=A0AAD4KYL3_9EURO|nr:uncharacterized protein BGW36DRAFT_358426 [Talaromyces proteolyticus]KAH8698916.1 hypothetical protein BGW36DRAFT_358426 [Talaromyces proteolyticus]
MAEASAMEERSQHLVYNAELSTTFATSIIPLDVQDTAENTSYDPSLNHPLTHDEGSESSSSSRRHSVNEQMLDDDLEDDRLEGTKSASSRSSLSSIPDSVVVHTKHKPIDNTHSPHGARNSDYEYNAFDSSLHQKIRDRNSPFRHASSVRAMQMYTEDEDEEYMSPSRRRGAGYRGSSASMLRSPGSPLARRHGYHSAGATPKKASIRTENPLVLLHCTILPPTVVLAPGLGLPNRRILERVLPPQFWRRWKTLEEKIGASGLLRDRGVLLQHPQEDYGLLEERLLESLELQRPRLENGHFISNNGSGESGNESNNEDDESRHSSAKSREPSCPDCGCFAGRHNNEKKWEVRFYAANGLMKEGAWTAAWKEIERVDVQVSLWLPYEVKIEFERQILEEAAALTVDDHIKKETQSILSDKSCLSQEEIDGLDYATQQDREVPEPHTVPYDHSEKQRSEPIISKTQRAKGREPDLHTLLINYIRILASDRRNIVTVTSVLLTFWVLIYSIQPKNNPFTSDTVRFGDFPAVSTQVYHTSSACILTEVPTEIAVVETEERMEGPSAIQRVAQDVNTEQILDRAATFTASSAYNTEEYIVHVQGPIEAVGEAKSIDRSTPIQPDVVDKAEPDTESPATDFQSLKHAPSGRTEVNDYIESDFHSELNNDPAVFSRHEINLEEVA